MKKNKFAPWIVVVVFLLVIGGFMYSRTITGNMILNDYSSTAYAPPYDINNSANFIFNVTPDNFTAEGSVLNLNVTVNMTGGYIYQKGYVFNFKENRWNVFNFIQTPVENSYWIQNFASSSLLINSSDMFRDGENYVVAYACKKVFGVWKCGCNNLSSANSEVESCANWMLQIVNLSNVTNPVVNITCTTDANCSLLDRCVGGYCVFNGTGTPNNNISISTCEELQGINNNLNGNYELMQDIDCVNTSVAGASVWGVNGFRPLGNVTTSFSGNFNGNGYVISNLYINHTVGGNLGLFSSIGAEANVSNVGLVDAYIYGNGTRIGILAGQNLGVISKSYTSGQVYTNADGGGLVGVNNVNATITNSYSLANLSYVVGGGFYNGGLVGSNYGNISNSYSVGHVDNALVGTGGFGGFVANGGNCNAIGNSNDGCTTNSFWDTQSSGQSNSVGGIGLTTSQMKNRTIFVNAGWDFENTWEMTIKVDGSDLSDNYPQLNLQN